jgi:hypothetical protein
MRSAEDKAALAREVLSLTSAEVLKEAPTGTSFRRLDRQP